jgi:putative endonuclease
LSGRAPPAKDAVGRAAESLVADYVAKRGFEIVGRNVRVGRLELDILARRGKLLVVVEVRSRSTDRFGSPLLTVDKKKIARVRQAAARWLAANEIGTAELRFDAAAVTFLPGEDPRIEYYERAF